MAWQDLLNLVPMYIQQIINNPDGYIVTADRWNELFNLLITQGDQNSAAIDDLIEELDTLIISNPNAGENIGVTVPGLTATELTAALIELLGYINSNDVDIANNAAAIAQNVLDIASNLVLIQALQTDKADLVDVYLKTQLQTSGQSQVHWENLTNVPAFADDQWKAPVATFADLPMVGNEDGDLRLTLDDDIVYTWNETPGEWTVIGASGSGISDHGQLLNLNNDDHAQYLRTDGTRTLTGNLLMGGFQIRDVLIHIDNVAPAAAEAKLWYDDINHQLKVYNGSGWVNTTGVGAVIQSIEITATAGQTVFDISNGNTQSYNTGDSTMQVHLKNAEGRYELLDQDDYVETDGETITLNTPANLDDEYYFRWQKNIASIVDSISDGSITDYKLSDDVGQIKDRVTTNTNNIATNTGNIATNTGETASNLNRINDINQPKTTTVLAQEVSFSSNSGYTDIFTLELAAEVSGGPITIKKNTDAAKPLKLYDGTVVETLPAGFSKIVETATDFIYALGSSAGGCITTFEYGLSPVTYR